MLSRLSALLAVLVLSLEGCATEAPPGGESGRPDTAETSISSQAASRAAASLPERTKPPTAPDRALQTAVDAFGERDALRLWDLLPVTYTQRWQAGLRTAIATTDPQTWGLAGEVLDQTVKLCEDRGEWLAEGMYENRFADSPKTARELVSVLERTSRVLRQQVFQNQEQARALDLRKLLHQAGPDLLSTVVQLCELNTVNPLEFLEDAQVELQSENEARAVVILNNSGGMAMPLHLLKVEDAWVPNTLTLVQELALASLENSAELPPREQAVRNQQYDTALREIRGTLVVLNQQASKAAFQQALGSAATQLLLATTRLQRLNSRQPTSEDLQPRHWCRLQFDTVLNDEQHAMLSKRLSRLTDRPQRALVISGTENGQSWFDVEPVARPGEFSESLVQSIDFVRIVKVDDQAAVISVQSVSP